MLSNMSAYYLYGNLVRNGKIIIETDIITNKTWYDHYNGILNILRDGIETDYVQSMIITVQFPTGETVDLLINDYYLNLLFWFPIIILGDKNIQPQHLVFKNALTGKDIKNYVDKFFIIPRKTELDNKLLNNIVAETIEHFIDIDEFSMFLSNTLNLEDSIELMNANEEYYKLLHADLSDIPLENMKSKGMELVSKAKNIIIHAENYISHEHCLRNPFISGEGINEKQYKDNSINIGTKPDGQGSIYHERINRSYITGGLNDLVSQYIDSASARVAQIISKKNIGDSGGFSRILGLNNENTFLYPDPNFDCGTNNYIIQYIPNKEILDMLNDRYYKLHPDGELLKISSSQNHNLIGQTIYLRSPIFCVSHAHGKGVCYKCYGDLAYVNKDINIGRIASEIITSQYIQMRLSAKHLLEANIKILNWNENFYNFFTIDVNAVKLRSDLDTRSFKDWKFIIQFNEIELEKDEDFFKHKYSSDGLNAANDDPFYNEYVTSFLVVDPNGEEYQISATIEDDMLDENLPGKLYITSSLGALLKENTSIDDISDEIVINLLELADIPVFLIKMENNDLGKNLDMFDALINKKDVTKKYDAHSLVERMQKYILKGGIRCKSIQLEILISNQIRNINDRLLMPNWYNRNEPYEILTLNEALTDNPSIVISLTYRKLSKALNYPLSFRKIHPSIFDLFFMRKPKKMLNADYEVLDNTDDHQIQKGECPVIKIKDFKTTPKPKNLTEFIKRIRKVTPTKLDDK